MKTRLKDGPQNSKNFKNVKNTILKANYDDSSVFVDFCVISPALFHPTQKKKDRNISKRLKIILKQNITNLKCPCFILQSFLIV
jgi:hypothetical protein